MWLDGWFGKQAPDANDAPGRQGEGAAFDKTAADQRSARLEETVTGAGPGNHPPAGGKPDLGDPKAKAALFKKAPVPNVSALNSQIVQAVQFSNAETSNYAGEMVATPPEMMVSTTTGLAVQDAKNYMNAIMQIAVAAQAVAIKKAAEGPEPVAALKEIPLLAEIQSMVTEAVGVYGTVSTTAGTSASTVIGDLNSG